MSVKYNFGQSLIEVVVAVGIVALVLSGMVVLMTNSLGSKTKGFDRNKAVEMSEVIMEGLVNTKNNDPNSFWAAGYLDSLPILPEFPGYTYIASSIPKGGGIEVKIVITWADNSPQNSATFTRYFAKY